MNEGGQGWSCGFDLSVRGCGSQGFEKIIGPHHALLRRTPRITKSNPHISHSSRPASHTLPGPTPPHQLLHPLDHSIRSTPPRLIHLTSCRRRSLRRLLRHRRRRHAAAALWPQHVPSSRCCWLCRRRLDASSSLRLCRSVGRHLILSIVAAACPRAQLRLTRARARRPSSRLLLDLIQARH